MQSAAFYDFGDLLLKVSAFIIATNLCYAIRDSGVHDKYWDLL